MALLNSNNFIQFFDPLNTSEFTTDGDFANGLGSDIDTWNQADTAPIGSNTSSWIWQTTLGGSMAVDTNAGDSKGLSQELRIENEKIYHIEVSAVRTSGGTVNLRLFFINTSSDYQEFATLALSTSTSTWKLFVKANANYNKIMAVMDRTGATSGNSTLYTFKALEFNKCYYSLPLIKDDALSIFFNGTLDNTVDIFSQLKVGLWHNDIIYLRDIATLNQVVISGNYYQLYFSWTVPALPIGNFRFVIYDDSSGDDLQLYLSNSMTYKTSKKYTSFLKYKNSINGFNFYYETVPTIYNQLRIDLWSGLPTYPKQKDGYQTYEGVFIAVKTSRQKLREFQTRFFNEIAHEGFDAMLMHDEIYIDDIEYILPEGQNYDISWSEDDGNRIGTGIVNLEEVSYSTSITQC